MFLRVEHWNIFLLCVHIGQRSTPKFRFVMFCLWLGKKSSVYYFLFSWKIKELLVSLVTSTARCEGIAVGFEDCTQLGFANIGLLSVRNRIEDKTGNPQNHQAIKF